MSVITLTPNAVRKVRELTARDGREGYALRVKVAGGGCSGLQYQLMFDNQAGKWDQESVQDGVRILVDAKSAVYLTGTTVDYVDELNESGFKIENPSATSTCGCGESFSA